MSLPHFLLALVANFAWGCNFIAGKIGAEHFQPLLFTSLRFLFLLLLMLPWLKPAKGYMFPLLRVAFLLGICHFSMMFLGLHAGGNIASVAITSQLYVPFSALLAFFLLREKISLVSILATALALSGVVLIGFDPIVFNHIDAILWIIGAAFAMALATIFMRQCPHLGVFKLQAWIALVAAPSLFLLSLLFETDQMLILLTSDIFHYWTPVYSAIGASIIGHGIVYFLLGKYPVSRVTPILLLAPIIASIFGVIFLDDVIGWKLIIGGTMTLIGVLIIALLPEYEKRKRPLL